MHSKWFKFTVYLIAFIVFFLSVSYASASEVPVHFTADRLDHSDVEQIVTAYGDVELIQGKEILHADQMSYDLEQDIVTAIGNVSLLDENGQVHFAEYLQLSNQMKDGFVNALTSFLVDGSRFQAAEAQRIDENLMIMKQASYTPCKICESGKKEPTWQIKADEVIYDKNKGSVKYDNAHLEVLGVPLAYTPFFSHPDPTLDQKSGFLRPSAGWNSELGIYASGTYYWGLDNTKDVSLKVQPSGKQGVFNQVEYRQRFANGFVNLSPSVAFWSDRTEEEDNRIEENLTRGHIEGKGRFDLNDKWRAGFDVMRSSDKEYLRLYDVSNENVLENIAYAERFDNRDYTNINAQQYQDVRLGLRPEQPDVLPSIYHSMLGAPESLLGGRLSFETGLLGLKRSGESQDVNRASAELGWQNDFITNYGLSVVTNLSSRVDYYNAKDLDAALLDPTQPEELDEFRFFPQVHSVASYPMVKNASDRQYIIEPRVAFTAGSHANEADIPNEDSRDIQLDALNLYEANRFPGEDVQDTGTRVTYGLGGGIYKNNGAEIKAFVGQSYRFNDDNIFPEGSGLTENRSDYVGSFHVNLFDPDIFMDYRFQLDEHNLSPQRHELQADAIFGPFNTNARYTFSRGVQGTGFTQSREQLSYGAGYQLNDNWKLSGGVLYDLSDQSSGLRSARAGLLYSDDCFNFNLLGTRRITNRATGESETSLVMRVGFKYLGEVSSPEILLQGSEGE